MTLLSLSIFLSLKTFSFKVRRTTALLHLFAGIFGFYSILAIDAPIFPVPHISQFTDGSFYIIKGKIVSFKRHYSAKIRLTLESECIEKINGKKKKLREFSEQKVLVSGRIFLNVYRPDSFNPEIGDSLIFKASLKPIRNFDNSGGFDYRKFLLRRQITGAAYTNQHMIIIERTTDLSFYTTFLRNVEKLRNRFFFFVKKILEDKPSAHVITALITGKKHLLSQDLRDDFSKAGVSHILAISGLHMSIISFFFYWMFYSVFALFHPLLISGWAKKLAGVFCLIPLSGYAVFAGLTPSIQRSFIMIGVFMISILIDEENSPLNILALSGLLILTVNSAALFSISFQLSFAAVAFIFIGMERVGGLEFLNKRKGICSILAKGCLVSFFAEIGTLPLVARYFNIISFIQIPANLILLPIFGFICLPLSLAGLLIFCANPAWAAFPLEVSAYIIDLSITAIKTIISIPFAWTRIFSFNIFELMLIYGLMMFLYLLTFPDQKKLGIWGICIIIFTGIIHGSMIFVKKIKPGQMSIDILDVGQGNACLIQTIEGKNILVDGGGFPSSSSFDVGRYVVAHFLWNRKILSLDQVILTHPESDHMNGLLFVLQNFKVKMLIKNQDATKSSSYKDLMNVCKKKIISIVHPGNGYYHLYSGPTRIFFYQSSKLKPFDNLNENSLVFKLILKDFSILFTGDIMKKRETRIVTQADVSLSSKVLMAPHHGSNTSSKISFLEKVRPESIIVSCGEGNRYGFPHPKVLQRYKKLKAKIYRTDKNGMISIATDGFKYRISTYK